jgi:hypothetical protein
MSGRPAFPQLETAHVNTGFVLWLRAGTRWGLLLTLALLPFELTAGLPLAGLIVTNVEVASAFTLLSWAMLLWQERRGPQVSFWLLLTAALFVGSLLLSALLAEEQRTGALKFALRQGQGALVACCLAERLRLEGPRLAQQLGVALLAGAGVSALLGLLEMSEWPPVLALLGLFKEQRALVGGFLRLSGTFSYANTAAMYMEGVLGLALLYGVGFDKLGRRLTSWLSLSQPMTVVPVLSTLLPLLLLLAIIFTYSRTALVVSGLVLLVTPLVAWRIQNKYSAQRTSLFAGALVLVGAGLLVGVPALRLRLSEPDIGRWYRASYQATALAPMAPGELRKVEVTLTNEGLATWTNSGARPFRLSYHWLGDSGRVVRFEGRRSELPGNVAPGERITLQAMVQAPEQVGTYRLAWDMVRENMGGGWFSQLGTPPLQVAVEVRGTPAPAAPTQASEPATTPRRIEAIPPPPARGPLWSTALTLWRERPVFGIGPDVFRHVYGPHMGLSRFDDRVHTNNLYLELLTGAGLVGLASFALLVGQALWRGGRAVWAGQAGLLAAGALVGLLATLAHGTLDVFLAFTPTYMLSWSLIGALEGDRWSAKG